VYRDHATKLVKPSPPGQRTLSPLVSIRRKKPAATQPAVAFDFDTPQKTCGYSTSGRIRFRYAAKNLRLLNQRSHSVSLRRKKPAATQPAVAFGFDTLNQRSPLVSLRRKKPAAAQPAA